MGFAATSRFVLLAALGGWLAFNTALAANPAFVAHFASLSRDKVYLRQGPGYRYRILWEYHRRGYPVRVTASYDAWRRIVDQDGSVGWIHQTMVTDARTILIIGKGRATARLSEDPRSPPVALLEPGVVARLRACKPSRCKVEVDGTAGWIDRQRLWGVNAGEVFE